MFSARCQSLSRNFGPGGRVYLFQSPAFRFKISLRIDVGGVETCMPKPVANHRHVYLVGSSTGAVIRRKLLVCVRRFHLRARLEASVIPFPAPATSHAACGFPALRAPALFTSRVMRPIEPKQLPAGGRDNRQTDRVPRKTTVDPTASSRSPDASGPWPSGDESSPRPSYE
jgi:hypothetical protein